MTQYNDPIANIYVEMLIESENPVPGYSSQMHKDLVSHIRDELKSNGLEFQFNDKLKNGTRSLKTISSPSKNHIDFLNKLSKYGVKYRTTADVPSSGGRYVGGDFRVHIPPPTSDLESSYSGRGDFPTFLGK